MNATNHVTWPEALRALDRCTLSNPKQGCIVAVSFGLFRGAQWGARNSLGAALDLADELRDDDLRTLVGRAIRTQIKREGDEQLSVSDCSRVHWARRLRSAWDDYLEPQTGAPWPGGSGWLDLRLVLESREHGREPVELAAELGLPARSIRARAARLSLDPQWMGIVPLI